MRRAFLLSPEMVRRTRESEDSRTLLSACADLATLRELSEAGFDMESLRGADSGRNPLHWMAARGDYPAALRKALALCPAWGSQTDARGNAPAALCEDPKAAAALEKALAGMTVAKAPKSPKASRRSL